MAKAGNKKRKQEEEADVEAANEENIDNYSKVANKLEASLAPAETVDNNRTQASGEFYQGDEILGFIFREMFCDPETGEMMADPVVIPSGNSHERVIGLQMNSAIECYSNRALKAIIEAYAKEKQQQQQQQGKEGGSSISSALKKGQIFTHLMKSKTASSTFPAASSTA